ncbi:MAG: dNTP triphosphohydrolase [Clostridiales bacterium]|nr:dNTP triphosphohydrolase [Clostridiales bacterium]
MSNKEESRMDWESLLCDRRLRESRKREYKGEDTFYESPFANDKRRIVTSASFRRLQDKTQVFPMNRGDFVRTRLTHSIEVATLGSTLGSIVGQKLTDLTSRQKEALPLILECAGYIHDIGNPPFGHFGEKCIRRWFGRNLDKLVLGDKSVKDILDPVMTADFSCFEGNAQGLRVVGRLHSLIDDHGMNLTCPLLATMIKYPVSSLEKDPGSDDIRKHKMGYYHSEKKMFDDLSQILGTNGRRHPLTFLLEVADDIAYVTADIEDAVKTGLILYHDLTDIPDDICRERLNSELEKAAANEMPDKEINAVQNFLGWLRIAMLHEAGRTFCTNIDRILLGTYNDEIMNERDYGYYEVLKFLKDLETEKVFKSPEIVSEEAEGGKYIDELLDHYIPAAVRFDTEDETEEDRAVMATVSESYMKKYRNQAEGADGKTALYYRLQLVTDYICGMTDHYAAGGWKETIDKKGK